MDRTIIANNDGVSIAAGSDSMFTITCCDFWGNTGGDWGGDLGPWYGVDGNICADPLFCDPSSLELWLDRASPCVPPNTECERMGAWDVGCDVAGVPENASLEGPRGRIVVTPNPFRDRAVISLPPPGRSQARSVRLYDGRGRLVRDLSVQASDATAGSCTWDGRDSEGHAMPAGVYFIRMPGAGAAAPAVLIR